MTPLFAFLSVPTMIVLGIIGVLIFGRRLPDMAKYVGKSVVAFKAGLNGLETGIGDVTNLNTQAPAPAPARVPSRNPEW